MIMFPNGYSYTVMFYNFSLFILSEWTSRKKFLGPHYGRSENLKRILHNHRCQLPVVGSCMCLWSLFVMLNFTLPALV